MAVRKIAITLPEEMFEFVERARQREQRSRSDYIQEAIRSYADMPVYYPTEDERRALDEALEDLRRNPNSGRPWDEVRREIWPDEGNQP